jgi:hypothetical protein
MARRRRLASEPGINLFSFLNIMTATIGVQALLIVIFALQIKPGVQSIKLLPAGGEGRGREANYILCNGSGELELIGNGRRQTVRLGSPDLESFLDRIENSALPQYLVVGVRPSAFPDFESVRSKAEARRLVIGFEPLEKGLKVIVPGFKESVAGEVQS